MTAGPVHVYHPQLATLVKKVPEGDLWLHEIKYDGYRIGCRIEAGEVTLTSRNGNDWTDSFPEICDAAVRLGVNNASLDGEIAIEPSNGRTSFHALQKALGGGSRAGLAYFVFDLLYLDGEDVSRQPLETRKSTLSQLIAKVQPPARIRYAEHIVGNGKEVFREVCRLGLEGVVSKRRDLPYRPGRGGDWLKIKCTASQEFVIGGFTEREGRRNSIGALLIGLHDESGHLAFAGKVRTGFNTREAQALRKSLEALEQKDCPFDPRPAGGIGRDAHWVRPELVAQVAFTEWTPDRRVRHPSFKGLRQDKAPREVVFEAWTGPQD